MHCTPREPERTESFTELTDKIVSKLEPPKLGKIHTVPMPVESNTPIAYDSCASNASSKKPASFYEAYENHKRSKSKRKLFKQKTKILKVSILENNADAMIKDSPSSSFYDNKS